MLVVPVRRDGRATPARPSADLSRKINRVQALGRSGYLLAAASFCSRPVPKEPLGVDLVLEDLSLLTERENCDFVLREVPPALEKMAPGGSLAVRLVGMRTVTSKVIVWALLGHFDTVELCKPRGSPPCSSELFARCRGYCGKLDWPATEWSADFPIDWLAYLVAQHDVLAARRREWVALALEAAEVLIAERPYLSEQQLGQLTDDVMRSRSRSPGGASMTRGAP